MNTLTASSGSYLQTNPEGKIETSIDKIEGAYVYATCRLYGTRTDTSYMVCETGIAEKKAEESISGACSIAINMAYRNALARVLGMTTLNEETEPGKDEKPTILGSFVSDTNQEVEHRESKIEPTPTNDSVVKLDLSVETQRVNEKKENDEENTSQIESSYLDEVIDVLGKPHECNGWTVKQLLEKRPDVIVNFYPRYGGRNERVKAALKAAYPEAIRRHENMQTKAA